MHRNESVLIAASYFWSDTLNAFVFGHGPASPTLADVLMLTGLDVSTVDSSHIFDTTPSAKVETHSIGGWSGYIQKYRRTGPVNIKEQTTFLNMWLVWIFIEQTTLYSAVDWQDQPLSTYRQQRD